MKSLEQITKEDRIRDGVKGIMCLALGALPFAADKINPDLLHDPNALAVYSLAVGAVLVGSVYDVFLQEARNYPGFCKSYDKE
jgi:hypothetical protein